MNSCPTRRLPTNPGISLIQADQTRISALKSGRYVTGPAKQLPNGFWLTDLPMAKAEQIRDARRINQIIHCDGWLGASWQEILNDYGACRQMNSSEAAELAKMSERIIRLSIQAITKTDYWQKSGQLISHRRSFGRPSLPFAMSDYLLHLLNLTRPRNSFLADNCEEILLFGALVHRPRRDRPRLVLKANQPKITYLRRLARQDYPRGKLWTEIKIPCRLPMSEALMVNLRNLQRPVILCGTFQSHKITGPTWVHSWCRGKDPMWGRAWFTLLEIAQMREVGEFHLNHAFAGRCFMRPFEGTVLGRVTEGLVAACQSEQSAHSSYSAGLAAENLIRAACINAKFRRPPASMESAWIAAHDRIACLDGIKAAEAAGARFMSSHTGSIMVSVESNREAIVQVVNALWKAGYHLPVGRARQLRQHKLNFLACPCDFGGRQEDLTMAVASQLGLCEFVHRMDEIAGSGKARQGKKLKQFETALAQYLS